MDKRVALIATLLKSGTWYAHTFFWCYDQLLRNAESYLRGDFTPDLIEALRSRRIGNESSHRDTFGIDTLLITHSFCPGMQELNDPHRAEWQALHTSFAYRGVDAYIRDHGYWDRLMPQQNAEARIVYFYRNPLDHLVSYYRHTLNMKERENRLKVMPDGARLPIENLQDFVFNAGALSAFIRHYYSFRQMHRAFPKNIMPVLYRNLVGQPEKVYADMLAFMGIPMHRRLFEDALAMCSKESLMAAENTMGRSLAGDQANDRERHIRDGTVGKWREYFSREDIERIESVLHAFDITLNEFMPSDSASELSYLSRIDPVKKQHYQLEFFRQQLAMAGVEAAALHDEVIRMKSHMRVFQLFKYSRMAIPLRVLVKAYRNWSGRTPRKQQDARRYSGA